MGKKRVALVLSGGVSLGSYIAGALDELLRALHAGGDYELDVIVGASAGATTAAIIAHGLLYRGGTTALHQTWVERVDMAELLSDTPIPAGEPLTLLSSMVLRQMAEEATPALPAEQCRASPLCADELTLALTITNLEGLSYVSRVRLHSADSDELFIQQRFAEQERFRLRVGEPSAQVDWGRIREVALASAALPTVFPPVPLRREAKNPDHYPRHTPEFSGAAEFLYCDGGVFNNVPIDLAVAYAEERDRDGLAERLYLIVDPSRDMVRAVPTASDPRARPLYRNTALQIARLLAATHAESSAVQFENEMLAPALSVPRPAPVAGGLQPESLPGIRRPDVKVLEQFRVVLPTGARRLKGSYLSYALSAFLDRSFREYDFRRGAADARLLVVAGMGLAATPERAEGPSFYDPDQDPLLGHAIDDYAQLALIASSTQPGASVRAVFEAQLRRRIRVLVRRLALPGPRIFDRLYVWIAERLLFSNLPQLWKQ